MKLTICDIIIHVCARVERQKRTTSETQSLFVQIPATKRLKSRHCFLSSVQLGNITVKVIRCSEWRKRLRYKPHICIINLHEKMAISYDSLWTTWNASNVCTRGTLAARHNEISGIIHRRHHMCLWKSRRNHGTHVTYSAPNFHIPALWMTSLRSMM